MTPAPLPASAASALSPKPWLCRGYPSTWLFYTHTHSCPLSLSYRASAPLFLHSCPSISPSPILPPILPPQCPLILPFASPTWSPLTSPPSPSYSFSPHAQQAPLPYPLSEQPQQPHAAAPAPCPHRPTSQAALVFYRQPGGPWVVAFPTPPSGNSMEALALFWGAQDLGRPRSGVEAGSCCPSLRPPRS